MTLYLDTSALVKLYVSEPGSKRVKAAVDATSAVVTSRLAYVETRAALGMAVRTGRISGEDRALAVAAFGADWKRMAVVEVTQALVELADNLSEAMALRGYDAIHLASAVSVWQGRRAPVRFMAWDQALLLAASQIGLITDGGP